MPGRRTLIEPNSLDSARQSQQLKYANAPPVEINFVPAQAMLSRSRMSMVIVVPPFTKSQQGDPPTVPRVVVSLEALRAPHMRGRVDEPRRMQRQCHAKKNTPKH